MGDDEGSAGGSQMTTNVLSPTSRRPKPRIRDAVSVEATESRQRSPSTALVVSSASESPVLQHVAGIKLPAGYGNDDDDDDFFDRARRKKERIQSNASIEFDDPLPPFPADLDDSNGEEGKRRKRNLRSESPFEARSGFGHVKRKPYVSNWSRTKSKNSKREETSSQSNSDSDSSEEEKNRRKKKKDAGSDVLTSPITSSSPVKDSNEKDAHEAKRKRDAKSTSKSPTKSRLFKAEQQRGIRQIVESSLPSAFTIKLNEETEKNSAMSDEDDYLNTVDPDLRRYVKKGKKAGEKRDVSQRAEGMSSKRALPSVQKVQAPSVPRQHDAMSKAPPSSTVHSSKEPVDTIELSDSDDDFRPSAKTSNGSQSNGPLRRSARTARQPSSSPPILVYISQNVRGEPSTGNAPQQAAQGTSSSPTVVSSDEHASSTNTDPVPEEVVEKEEEVDRINVIMKGGEGGSLKVSVCVLPTTRMERLLDYFIDLHRDKIPSNRISKVRLRFDGDILKDKDTVESIGIEDEEQLDVVW